MKIKMSLIKIKNSGTISTPDRRSIKMIKETEAQKSKFSLLSQQDLFSPKIPLSQLSPDYGIPLPLSSEKNTNSKSNFFQKKPRLSQKPEEKSLSVSSFKRKSKKESLPTLPQKNVSSSPISSKTRTQLYGDEYFVHCSPPSRQPVLRFTVEMGHTQPYHASPILPRHSRSKTKAMEGTNQIIRNLKEFSKLSRAQRVREQVALSMFEKSKSSAFEQSPLNHQPENTNKKMKNLISEENASPILTQESIQEIIQLSKQHKTVKKYFRRSPEKRQEFFHKTFDTEYQEADGRSYVMNNMFSDIFCVISQKDI